MDNSVTEQCLWAFPLGIIFDYGAICLDTKMLDLQNPVELPGSEEQGNNATYQHQVGKSDGRTLSHGLWLKNRKGHKVSIERDSRAKSIANRPLVYFEHRNFR